MKLKSIICVVFLLCFSFITAQQPSKLTSNEIYEKLKKLNFLGTALYVAAHPDDENTRLIAYLSNHIHARTGYLSLTRGDGGQNLIGPEMRTLLGVIRTQELLAARRIDGGEQLFSRANDFGYSKHPDETFRIWQKDTVLADVVWAIRQFKPDVIINRFNHRKPGTTHGHHTASAMLSMEAFDLASDATQFSHQLQYTTPWQPKRLFFNTSWWFYGSQKAFEAADKSNMLQVDVGVFYPQKGVSNNELATVASSQHLCQGFGRLTTRGSQYEWLEFLKGDFPTNKNDIFSGINTTWSRVDGGGAIGAILYKVEQSFDFVNPSSHLPELMQAYQLIQKLTDPHWKRIKTKELEEIIYACAGLYLEASATSSSATPNTSITLDFEVLNRSTIPVKLSSIELLPQKKVLQKEFDLAYNAKQTFQERILLNDADYSAPYWLHKSWSLGMYTVDDQLLIGKPETPRPLRIVFNVLIDNKPISFVKDVIHRYSKREKGEIYEPFEVLPKVTTTLSDKVLLFSSDASQNLALEVRSGAKQVSGKVRLQVPEKWQVTPKTQAFSIEQKGDKQRVNFTVTPPKNPSEGKVRVIVTSDEKQYDKELIEIHYNHIPKQSVLLPSEAKIVRLDIKKAGNHIGYIQGSGDAVPKSLRQIGYEVTEILPEHINTNSLAKFDAVVLGIRAYNTQKQLQFKQKYLLEYVKEGGTLIVQYNTNRRVDVQAPFLLQLSRDRVTDEHAPVTLLAKNHPVLNYPNTITQADFNGWVQERGLYFPNKWSQEYTPILSMHDRDETAKKGSLLVAKYGKGHYVYTGLSFFRELPAGVPGAYKIFANMLSLGTNR